MTRGSRGPNAVAFAVGIGCLVLFLLVMEALIQFGFVNRFIIPPPSEVALSFERVIVEEDILHRFLLTATECLTAGVMLTVFGVIGVLRVRSRL